MPAYEVEHAWNANETNSVVAKVQETIGVAKAGKLPPGFRPVSIVGLPGQTKAHCLWEAPSPQALDELFTKSGLRTTRTIREVTPFFVR